MSELDPIGDADPAELAADLPRRIAVAGRALDDEGCAPGVGGQISVRDPLGRGFFAVAFELLGRVRPERVALLDDELRLLQGQLRLPAAMGTHAALYRRRPEVGAVVHLHAPNVAALSATGRLLGMHHVSSVLFAGEQVRHVDDGTAPHSAVVDTLGDHHVAIMANHGALLVADSLERAVVEAVTLEFCAGVQLACEVVGGATEIAPDEVDAGRRNFAPHHVAHSWAALEARVLDERADLRRSQPWDGPGAGAAGVTQRVGWSGRSADCTMRFTRPDIEDVDVESCLANLHRLREVRASGLLGAPRSEHLDALARSAAQQLDAPMAWMSVLDDHREFRTASYGRADLPEIPQAGPASASFCQFVVATDGVFAVNDARVDPLVKDLALAASGRIRAYLGVPIRRNGQVLGSFCVADMEPRNWTDEDVVALERVAAGVDTGGT